jgi:hypothetical protein
VVAVPYTEIELTNPFVHPAFRQHTGETHAASNAGAGANAAAHAWAFIFTKPYISARVHPSANIHA